MSRDHATISVTETRHVARPPEAVFDYTQDYATRGVWDPSVTKVEVFSQSPRQIRIAVGGLGSFTVVYRLFRRPRRTSAAFVDVASPWIVGGGGSWRYETSGDGTDWTQTNTLILKRRRLLRWIAPIIERNLRRAMRRSMAEAKGILERG
jgi:hypothetical protein